MKKYEIPEREWNRILQMQQDQEPVKASGQDQELPSWEEMDPIWEEEGCMK